jgi:hypothetical protein
MTDQIDTSRRAMTLGLATAFLTPTLAQAQAPALGKTGETSPVAGQLSADAQAYFTEQEPFFKQFAQEFTLDPNVVYFMAAQKGTIPKSVMTRFKEGLDQSARDPFPVYVEPSAKTRATIARCYGTTPVSD